MAWDIAWGIIYALGMILGIGLVLAMVLHGAAAFFAQRDRDRAAKEEGARKQAEEIAAKAAALASERWTANWKRGKRSKRKAEP